MKQKEKCFLFFFFLLFSLTHVDCAFGGFPSDISIYRQICAACGQLPLATLVHPVHPPYAPHIPVRWEISCLGVRAEWPTEKSSGWVSIEYLFPQSCSELIKWIPFHDIVNCSQANSVIWWVSNNCYSTPRKAFSIQLLPIRENIWPVFPYLAYFTKDNQLNSISFSADDEVLMYFLAE